MSCILDAGGLIAIDRGDRRITAMLRVLQQERVALRSSAAVVAQVWRGGARQAHLARVLTGVEVRPLATADAKPVGELQAQAKTRDVVDAHLALLVADGDLVLTSDPDDMKRLLAARRTDATVTRV